MEALEVRSFFKKIRRCTFRRTIDPSATRVHPSSKILEVRPIRSLSTRTPVCCFVSLREPHCSGHGTSQCSTTFGTDHNFYLGLMIDTVAYLLNNTILRTSTSSFLFEIRSNFQFFHLLLWQSPVLVCDIFEHEGFVLFQTLISLNY